MSVKQNQAVAEGTLTLSNTENQTNSSTNNDGFVVKYYDVFGVAREYWLSSYNDLRTDKNTITYQLYREPVSPQITIKQDGTEVTSINLERTGGVSSVIEIISTHPISIFKGIKSIEDYSVRTVNSMSSLYTVADVFARSYESRASFEYVLGEPRVESDGNYHYFLTLTPTMTNQSDTEPVKLGDLTFTSQIYKNGTRPNKWVVVEDTNTGLEIVKTLLRTDTVNIIDLNSDLGGINSGIPFRLTFLPSITNAVPGTVYRGNSNTVGNDAIFYARLNRLGMGEASGSSASQTKLFVAIPYGLTKESYGTGDVDFVASNNRYYYSQKEIDNTFGSVYRRVSVIQKGAYTYTLSGESTGDKTRDIDFLGETRNYNIAITPVNEQEIDYIIGTTENCQVTTNNNQITMSVPNRILDYSPKSITDTYYTDLFSKLPVSFDVLVSTVTSKNMNNLASNSQLGSLSTIKDTFLKLSSMPTQGTSGIDPEPAPIYYRDPVSGMVKFVRTIGTYDYIYRRNARDFRGVTRTGYTCKTITWSTMRYTESMKSSRNRRYGFQENEGMTGYNTSANFTATTNSLPDNTDDILVPGVYSLRSGSSPVKFIVVDSLPIFAKIGATYKVGSNFYDFQASSNIQHLCLVPIVQWSNMDEGEQMYKTLKYDKNGYTWNTTLAPLSFGSTYNIDRTPVVLPSSGAPASSSTLGQFRYVWNSIGSYSSSISYSLGDRVTYNSKVWECIQAGTGNTPTDDSLYWSNITSSVEQVSSLPTTRDAVDSFTIYKYYQSGQYYYYYLGPYQVCGMDPVYSIVATSLPSTWGYNPYEVGDYVIDSADSSIWKCKTATIRSTTAPHSDTTNWQKIGDIYTYGTTHYKYYHVNSVPDPVNTTSYSSLPSADNLTNPDYIKVTGIKTGYYRRGYNFVDTGGGSDRGIFDASGPRTDRFFKIGDKLFRLKNFAPEIACPNKFKTSTGTIENILRNANYPVSIVLKGDDSESGFGMTNQTEMGGYYFVDFNDYTVKTQAFEEKVDLKQKRVSKGIVFKLPDDTEYKLYLGEDENNNTINISVDPNTESVEACVGVFSLQNPITSTSSGSNPRVNVSGATCQYSLTSPSLDGSTNNLRIEFGKNEGDSDLVRTFEFSYTEDALNTLVTFVITQTSDPGEVRFSGNRKLYFLSNGLLTNSTDFGYFTFSTTIRNFTLNNIEIVDDFGNDLLDREKSFLGNPVTQSATYTTYRAQLVLKPNTRNYKLEKVRVKIGKVSGNTVTDRTLDESSAYYWKWNGTTWIEQTDYTPTFLETYYDVLPEIGETSNVVCVCNSLRAYQGYYSVALFNPGSTDSDTSEMIYRQTTDPNEIYQDFGYAEAPDTIPIITSVSVLPDIRTQKTVGLIYKIGEVYYYTYSDFITSDYTYGTINLPIATGTGTEGQQKFHTTVEQCEYDSNGNTTVTSLTDTFFDLASNYDLSGTSWKLWDASGQTPISTEVMDPRNYCNIRAVYSDSQNPDLVPYIETSYHNLPQGSTVNIEVDIVLRVKYNYSGSVSIDDDYKWIENKFTVYTRREWNNS